MSLLLLLLACATDTTAPDWTVEVALSALEGEIGDAVTATVTVTDAEGERVDEPTTLSTGLDDFVVYDGDELTFTGDGLFTVTASVDAWPELTGDAGPVVIDSNGPVISITSPQRGEHFEGESELTVSGIVEDAATGLASLTLDGEAVSVSSDGSFATSVTVGEGVRTLTFVAVDVDGNESDLLLSVMNGDYVPADEPMDPAIDVFLTQDGLGELAAVAMEEFDAETLEAELIASNPVVSDTVAFCVTYEGDLVYLDFSEARTSVASNLFGLEVTVEIDDLETAVDATIDLCSLSTSADTVTMSDTLTTLVAELSVTVPEPGDVEVEVSSVEVTFENLEVDYGTLEDGLDGLGLSLEDLGLDAATLVSLALEQTLADQIPPPIEEALESIAISEELELLDTTATLEALISDVWTDTDGIDVYLQVDAVVDGEGDVPEVPGTLVLGGAPEPDGTTPMAASISADALNRVLFAAWQGGVLSLAVTHEETGLDAETLGLLFEGAETMDLQLEPLMPPVVVAATGEGMFDLQLGELHIHASGLLDGVQTELATWSAQATGDISVEISEASGEIGILIDGLDVDVDEIDVDPNELTDAEFRELLLGGVAASQIGSLLPELSFALPELDGFSLELTDIGVTGADGTWVTAAGELSVVE